MSDNFLFGKEARDKMFAGADKVANVVKMTLGAAGANYVSEHTINPYYISSNDGVQLAKAINLDDPYEQIGAQIMQEIATKADKSSADGTTTAITLAQAIIKEGKDLEVHPMELKRSLEECIPIVEEALKAQVKEIDVDEVGTVATISAEDESIGNLIQEIYEKIGRDGIIFNDASKSYKDSYEIDKGVHISDCGFAHSYMGDMNEQGQFFATVDIQNPYILITKQKVNTIDDLNKVGFIAQAANKELVIFAEEVDGRALEQMVKTRLTKGFRTVVFKLPILWKDWWTEDIAKLTGATVIDNSLGIFLKDVTEKSLGTCARVIATGKTTNSAGDTFLDGTLDVSDHVKELMERGDDESKLRAARLNKKTAKYHVGALTEQALKYRADKVRDALGSAYQALHGGVLPGGGVALFNASKNLPNTFGGKILREALHAPIKQIMTNAGVSESEVSELNKNVGGRCGFNAKTMKYEDDMLEIGIVDAFNTVLNSFKSAISVAATVLTAQVVTLLPKGEDAPKDMFNPYNR
jgi:chaperonin GroEL